MKEYTTEIKLSQVKKCSNGDNCIHPLKNLNNFLPKSEFSKHRNGLKPRCKKCLSVELKTWKIKNRDKVKDYSKRYQQLYKDKIKAYSKEYQQLHKKEASLRNKKWRAKHRSMDLEKARKYDNERGKKYIKNRRAKDLNFKIRMDLRNSLSRYLSKDKADRMGHAVELLGISIEEFKTYISRKFLPGMSWDNWGKNTWHLDHIKPLSSFNLTDKKQQKEAFHYNNFQPLWAKDNLSKSDKIVKF